MAILQKHNKVLILKNQRSNHSRIHMMRSSLRRLMKLLKFLLTLLLSDSGDKKLIQTLSHHSRKLLVPRPDSEKPIRNWTKPGTKDNKLTRNWTKTMMKQWYTTLSTTLEIRFSTSWRKKLPEQESRLSKMLFISTSMDFTKKEKKFSLRLLSNKSRLLRINLMAWRKNSRQLMRTRLSGKTLTSYSDLN